MGIEDQKKVIEDNASAIFMMEREKKTVELMIKMFCATHHLQDKKVCAECQGLLDYATLRLDKCPFAENKPACIKCLTHCYKKPMREKITAVMRYSGPRMILKHPVLAFLHLRGSRKKVDVSSIKQESNIIPYRQVNNLDI